jgi:hypothetical protein
MRVVEDMQIELRVFRRRTNIEEPVHIRSAMLF